MSSRAERRARAAKRREEIKNTLIFIIGDHLPAETAKATDDELRKGILTGLRAMDKWVNEEARKNPQERSILNEGAILAKRFLERNLRASETG